MVGVRVEMPSNNPIVLLRDRDGDRYLPIWVGSAEEVLEAGGVSVPDEDEDEVEKFREFLDQISPDDFGEKGEKGSS